MKFRYLAFLGALLALSARAGISLADTHQVGPFTAPPINGVSNFSNPSQGQIVLDTSAGNDSFAGYTGSAWGEMANPSGNSWAISQAARLRVENAHLNGSGGYNSACSSSSCNIGAQSGAFTGVIYNSAGGYYVAYSTARFSSTPICTCNVPGGLCSASYGAGTVQIVASNVSGTYTDYPVDITCVGLN
jgi:hypothetical protein